MVWSLMTWSLIVTSSCIEIPLKAFPVGKTESLIVTSSCIEMSIAMLEAMSAMGLIVTSSCIEIQRRYSLNNTIFIV